MLSYHRRTILVLGALAVLAFLPLGCGRRTSHLVPVSGEVFVQGQPASGATVIFYPLNVQEPASPSNDGRTRPAVKQFPSATVGADGSFRLTTTSANDGAPPGEYGVAIVWNESYRDEGELVNGSDKLSGRYANPQWSGLKAVIQPGQSKLPRFDLN